MEQRETVLCAASAYEKKFYLNEDFFGLPQEVKDELKIMCVLFTEEAGGVITFVFESDGSLSIETEAAEDDYMYDEISSGLLVGEIRRKRQDMFEALSLYYRMFVLHEEAGGLFGEEDT